MSKFKRGDLVHLFRRNVPGIGLCLARVEDINEFTNFDMSDTFQKIFNVDHPGHLTVRHRFDEPVGPKVGVSRNSWTSTPGAGYPAGLNWWDKRDFIREINDGIMKANPEVERGLLSEFWNYNRGYSIIHKNNEILEARTDFSLVYWLKPPSDYSAKGESCYTNKSSWKPSPWLKKMT
jgi:hypothetical protein